MLAQTQIGKKTYAWLGRILATTQPDAAMHIIQTYLSEGVPDLSLIQSIYKEYSTAYTDRTLFVGVIIYHFRPPGFLNSGGKVQYRDGIPTELSKVLKVGRSTVTDDIDTAAVWFKTNYQGFADKVLAISKELKLKIHNG